MIRFTIIALLAVLSWQATAQEVPSSYENVDYIVTFGSAAEPGWGDDDFTQVYFFDVPKDHRKPIYFRVYDPEIGGAADQRNGTMDTRCKFSVMGGSGCFNDALSRTVDPQKGGEPGIELGSKIFGNESTYDEQWYTFGPFNPKEGDYNADDDRYVFKVVCQGLSGNDGNAYRLAMSAEADKQVDVEGGRAFTYEISFRLKGDINEIAHFYPFLNDKVISVQQYNFDFDDDGHIRLTSLVKNKHLLSVSGDGDWATSLHPIVEAEQNTSLDVHFIKDKGTSNDLVFHMKNQYAEAIPFFSIPLGGVPKYTYKVNVKSQWKNK